MSFNEDQENLEHCFSEGYRDYYAGCSETSNPYLDLAAGWWSDGWEDARDENTGSKL